MAKHNPSIVIIGAGVIGSCLAFFLSRYSSRVTLIDAGAEFESATSGSLGWINAHGPENPHHFKLRIKSITLWKTLARQCSAMPVVFEGGIDWDMPQEQIQDTSGLYRELGYNSKVLSRSELERIYPHKKGLPEHALFNADEGTAVPGLIARSFTDMAIGNGSKLMEHCSVTGFSTVGGKITGVQTQTATIPCDQAIVCAGTGSEALLGKLGMKLPMKNRPGMLFRTEPLTQKFRGVTALPNLNFWQLPDGAILAGPNQPGETEETPEEMLKSGQKLLQSFLPGGAKPAEATLMRALRPVPVDGMPVVGSIPGLENISLAVMHSGITLAPVMAELLASEILEEKTRTELDPYRFSRFTE